jgi:hypothetical protein
VDQVFYLKTAKLSFEYVAQTKQIFNFLVASLREDLLQLPWIPLKIQLYLFSSAIQYFHLKIETGDNVFFSLGSVCSLI